MLLPGIGAEGQRRLGEAHVVIVGVGALGCASADLLCRAGVGSLTLIDRDVVEESNLHRQTLFVQADADEMMPKAVAAAARLRAINPGVAVRAEVEDLSKSNASRLVGDGAAAILDGTDNFETRYLLNDVSVKIGLPLAYAGVVGTGGMQATFVPPAGACLRCVFPEPPPPGSTPTCDTAGVLNAVVVIAAAHQVTDVVRLIVTGEASPTTLVAFDPWNGTQRRLPLGEAKNNGCPCCGLRRFDWLEGGNGSRATVLCGQDSVQIAASLGARVAGVAARPDLEALAARWRTVGTVRVTPHLARGEFVERGRAVTITMFADGRCVVGNTREVEEARVLMARYVG